MSELRGRWTESSSNPELVAWLSQEHGAVEEGDDAYTLYRKRMQLGYKHRPNPLGNPRKSYY